MENRLAENTKIQLIDNQTQQVLSTSIYKNVKRMRNRADKLDLQYGAIRYGVKILYGEVA